MKLAAIMVHGIGGSSEDWAVPYIDRLEKKVLSELQKTLKDQAPADIAQVLTLRSVYWKTALQKPQTELQKALGRYFGWVIQTLNPWDSLFRAVYKKFYKYQNMVVTLFIGDIVGYMAKEGKMGVQEKLDAAVEALASEIPDPQTPVSFISHSLGTVIVSNYIYDKMDIQRKKGINRMDERFVFANMFTAGSPIALFSMKFGGPESFNLPVQVEDPHGRWVNFLDKDDPIAMPLRVLNDSYKRAVFSDYPVNSGWFWGTAHTEYFSKTDTLDLVAKKLAVDWIALNHKLPEERIVRLRGDYDRAVRTAE